MPAPARGPSRRRLSRLSIVVCIAALAACSSTPPKRSVYYQDDGPPDRVPTDIAAIPDAVPRVEPPHKAASRPYVALGRSYTPLAGDVTFRQRGMASWYGKQFHGNRTATGEIYDMFAMTAAHPTLPLPSYVRVTAVRNGRSVIVRVNDRGPFKHDRVIDLSYAAAVKLGIAAAGTGEVEVERITMAQIARGDWRRGEGGRGGEGAIAAGPAAVPSTTAVIAANPANTSYVAVPGMPAAPPVSAPLAVTSAAGGVANADLPVRTQATDAAAAARGWSVQLGAFAQESNAEALAGRTAALLAFLDAADAVPVRSLRVEKDGAVFRVLVGTESDREAAQSLARELERVLERPTTLVLR
jgi:rare lipoprotein A